MGCLLFFHSYFFVFSAKAIMREQVFFFFHVMDLFFVTVK